MCKPRCKNTIHKKIMMIKCIYKVRKDGVYMNISIQDPGKLINDGGSISATAEQFKNEITKIYQVVDDLKASWTGDSARRYTDGIESFKPELEEFAKLIGQFGELISAVGTDYQKLESEL